MPAGGIQVVFFDIGDTLGTAVVSTSPTVKLVAIEVFPFVPALLEDLARRDLRLGLISNTGPETGRAVDEVLRKAGMVCPDPRQLEPLLTQHEEHKHGHA